MSFTKIFCELINHDMPPITAYHLLIRLNYFIIVLRSRLMNNKSKEKIREALTFLIEDNHVMIDTYSQEVNSDINIAIKKIYFLTGKRSGMKRY